MHRITLSTFFVVVFARNILCTVYPGSAQSVFEDEVGSERYIIEGRVFPPEYNEEINWQRDTRIHVNGGEYIGFVKNDGSFTIHNVASGSYVVETVHPDYMYEPIRVEINSRGKIRARKVNYIQTSQVIQVPYPLKMKPVSRFRYFQAREQWRLTDFLFNPMVIMMILPLFLIMILPKMMNDPDTKEDFKQMSNMAKISELPEMSEYITSFFNGGAKPSSSKAKQVKKRQ